MDERQMMHGVPYSGQNVAGWLMSEKMNGCRAYWDGAKLWTRSGREIVAGPEIRRNLPEGIELDGEINAGRGQAAFEVARQAVQYGKFTAACCFSAFDAPDVKKPFAERYAFLQYILPAAGPVHYIEHRTCLGIEDALQFMKTLQEDGGEGVILRQPGNRYYPGRTEEVLKLKNEYHAVATKQAAHLLKRYSGSR